MIKQCSVGNRQSASKGEEATIFFVARIIALSATLGVQSLLAWGLAPEGRGAYAVCLVFSMLLGVIFTMGCDRASQHLAMSGDLSLSHSISAAMASTAVGSFIGMSIGWFLVDLPFAFFSSADATQFRVSLPLVPLSIIFMIFQLQFAGLRRFLWLGIINLVQVAMNLVFLAIAIWWFEAGVTGALLAYEISLVLTNIFFFYNLKRHCGLVLEIPKWLHIRPVLFYGARHFGARFGNLLDVQIGIFFLSIMATRGEIGLFAAVAALTLNVCVISQSIESTVLPRISADPWGHNELVGRAVRISLLLTGAAVAGLSLVSVPLIPLLFSASFTASIPLIWIIAPGVVFHGAALILMAHFRAINRPGINSLVIWLALVVNIGIIVTFYPIIGFSSAAWGMTAGFAVRLLALLALYKLIIGGRTRDIFRFSAKDITTIRDTIYKIVLRFRFMNKSGRYS